VQRGKALLLGFGSVPQFFKSPKTGGFRRLKRPFYGKISVISAKEKYDG
jgi:hypothetical protein